jgi:hypothetical protein
VCSVVRGCGVWGESAGLRTEVPLDPGYSFAAKKVDGAPHILLNQEMLGLW